jgi:hypothetical protein
MKYALLIYGDEARQPQEGSPEAAEVYQAYYSFTEDISKEGVNQGGEALHNSDTATSVRVRNGELSVTDGPFAETKEQLGGFYLIEVADLDAAIDVARRIPGALTGSIEVRPIFEFE